MKAMWAVGLLLAAMFAAPSAPVRPQVKKNKPAAKAVSHGPRRPASRSEAQEQAKTTHRRRTKTTVRRVVERRMVHGHWVRVSRLVRVPATPAPPPHPEPERLREIQQALTDKGYFKGDVNGEWNADSVAALKQFQTDQKLTPDGKINALSLIGLGLGPKHDSSVAALPPPAKPETTVPQ